MNKNAFFSTICFMAVVSPANLTNILFFFCSFAGRLSKWNHATCLLIVFVVSQLFVQSFICIFFHYFEGFSWLWCFPSIRLLWIFVWYYFSLLFRGFFRSFNVSSAFNICSKFGEFFLCKFLSTLFVIWEILGMLKLPP